VVVHFFRVSTSSPAARYLPISFVTTLLFFASVLMHELSHSLVANHNDLPIRRITLFVFGGVAQMSRDVTTPAVEFKMAVAGPMCSYALCLIFGFAAYLAYLAKAGTVSFAFMLLASVNLGLGTFNLIPAFPLDGGRILRSLLWHHSGDLEKSTRTASRLGEGLGGLLIIGGIGMLISDIFISQYDLLLAGIWFMLIGSFLVQAAYNSYRQVKLRTSLSGLTVQDVVRPGVPAVEASTTLEEVYKVHLERAPGSVIPVLAHGRLAATVDLPSLRSVDQSLWPDTPASQVARPISGEETVGLDQPLFDAMLVMERLEKEYLWVVDEGRLMGVVFIGDARRMAKQSEQSGGPSGPREG
jgi:Zn-dependent protease